jgi:hypothetical protein
VRNDALHNHKGGLEGRHTRRNDYGGLTKCAGKI